MYDNYIFTLKCDNPLITEDEIESIESFHYSAGISIDKIKERILGFIANDSFPEFWGYYSSYDWVVFCWIFGTMIELPKGFLMYCFDIVQLAKNNNIDLPPCIDGHNALEDARWTKSAYFQIMKEIAKL